MVIVEDRGYPIPYYSVIEKEIKLTVIYVKLGAEDTRPPQLMKLYWTTNIYMNIIEATEDTRLPRTANTSRFTICNYPTSISCPEGGSEITYGNLRIKEIGGEMGMVEGLQL